MQRKQLFESADQLKQVSGTTYSEYQKKIDLLINRINELMINRPDLENLIGENNTNMMKDNHANHARFIASILKNYNSDILVDSILWVFRAYRSHGFNTNYWSAQLNAWIITLKKILSTESYCEIYPYYEWMQINIAAFVLLSDKKFDAANSLH
jgi:hypothetical protein